MGFSGLVWWLRQWSWRANTRTKLSRTTQASTRSALEGSSIDLKPSPI